ncbi:VOC family protein [Mesorhizobium sp. B2-6-5]|uniref:2-oxoadipate dioxygenase/decarboxylase HglS n=1 Tax=Mesorhizobium sp. B2-6-5 TaxID=2589912 RepID=UPI0011279F1F|nr:VOC family protein [Mesorhizobium sp. B2-6-5]TPJ33484.1 VOC family protein [Mesorhizobium sp. B2-6-5]
MTIEPFVCADDIRSAFSAAMSEMYRKEVPAYGELLSLVADVNSATLDNEPSLRNRLERSDSLDRISEERHGAIRLGTADELSMMRRVFAVMGMYPVGYYDLSTAGVPVHSTAFRPIADASLKRNPFRVFTSLLRLDLLADEALREEARSTLAVRDIFTPAARRLVETAERDGGLGEADAALFVAEVLETFRWHDRALVDVELYHRLHDAHRLVADVVSFNGPHINHLTPRTLDIDAVQAGMPGRGIAPKAFVEGPPTRKCPILLRQTSFKALEESISFRGSDGLWTSGSHTARFGEVEQRGIALTPKGRALYDHVLEKARKSVRPTPDGANAGAYLEALAESFSEFPDDWNAIRAQKLGYFSYSLAKPGKDMPREAVAARDIEALVTTGVLEFDPIVYEDFLPVSAAGIFRSNLGDDDAQRFVESPNLKLFEEQLGTTVIDGFEHYARIEQASIEACLSALALQVTA